MLEDMVERKRQALQANGVQPLAIDDVKKGDLVEVYRIDKGFTDIPIKQVSRVKGYVLTEDVDGYWAWHEWFWLPGSHKEGNDG